MRKNLASLLVFVCLASLAACGSPKDKVIGTWKSEQKAGRVPTFMVITKDSLTLGHNKADIALDERDGKVVLRKAGTDNILLVLTVRDDGGLDANMSGFGAGVFLPSSEKEMQEILTPSPERIIGIWKIKHSLFGQTYYDVVEIGKGTLITNGEEEKITLASSDGAYRFEGSKQLKGNFIPHDADTLQSGNSFSGTLTLQRSSEQEAAELREQRSKLSQSILGIWQYQENNRFGVSPFAPPRFLEIQDNALLQYEGLMKNSEALAGIHITPHGFFLEAKTKVPGKYAGLTVTMQSSDIIRTAPGTPDPFSFSHEEWKRSDTATLEKAIGDYRALPEKVQGFWRSSWVNDQTKNYETLFIGANNFRWKGKDYKARPAHVKNNKFRLEDPDTGEVYVDLTLQDNGNLFFNPVRGTAAGTYILISEEEYKAIENN